MSVLAFPVPGPRRHVLIVEDEFIVAMLTEQFVLNLGWDVAGIASSVEAALAALDGGGVDFAILDVNLNGRKSFPVAAALHARRVPFVFATAYGRAGLEDRFADVPLVQKPFDEADLARAIGLAMEAAHSEHGAEPV